MKKVIFILMGLLALLAAGEGFRFNCPSDSRNAANVVAIYDNHFSNCGFDGVVLSWNIMEAPNAHIDCLR